jgi:hypothetical protein
VTIEDRVEVGEPSGAFRSPVEIAVSEIGCLARACATHLEDASARLGTGDPLARRFAALAHDHELIAAHMSEASHALGDLPREPDPDRETVGKILLAVRRALSGDERRLLLDERIAEEHALLAEIDKALVLELSAAVRARVCECRRMAEEALHALASPPPPATP